MENTSALPFPSSQEPWALLALSLSSHMEPSPGEQPENGTIQKVKIPGYSQ